VEELIFTLVNVIKAVINTALITMVAFIMIKEVYINFCLPSLLIFAFFISGKFGKALEFYSNDLLTSTLTFIVAFIIIVICGIKIHHKMMNKFQNFS